LDQGLIPDDLGIPEAAGDSLVDEVPQGAQPDALGGEEEVVVGAKGKLPGNILIHPPCDVHSVMQRDRPPSVTWVPDEAWTDCGRLKIRAFLEEIIFCLYF